MKTRKKLYRYDREYIHDYNSEVVGYNIELLEFGVTSETRAGFWIIPLKPYTYGKRRFVLKSTGYGKRYAYETKQEAFDSF